MLDKYACLEKLASLRRDEVIVTTMSVAAPWARLSDGPLDFAMVEKQGKICEIWLRKRHL